MRILLASPVEYPADNGVGTGLHPRSYPSGSAFHLQDLIAKGLGELGHTVFYRTPGGSGRPLPSGVTSVSRSIPEVDILHTLAFEDEDLIGYIRPRHRPWVTTCHGDVKLRGRVRQNTGPNWIFVSQALARLHDRTRYVWNGLDPSEYTYSSTKDDYILFIATMDRALEKGLDIAISLAKQRGFQLVVAGTANTRGVIEFVAEMCGRACAKYLGDVRGIKKAELFAGARALLFPSRLDEGFGLTIVEALLSGTPVICSDRGAFREIVSSDVGFVCSDYDDYLKAVDQIGNIDARICRDTAANRFHYLRMARDYVDEYGREIDRTNQEKLRRARDVVRAHKLVQAGSPRH